MPFAIPERSKIGIGSSTEGISRWNEKIWNLLERFVRICLALLFRILQRELTPQMADGFVQFVKFCLIGVSNTVCSYVVYLVTLLLFEKAEINFRWDYVIGNLTGFLISVVWSWFWNSRLVFQEEEGEKRVWWKTLLRTYVAYAFTGVVLYNVLAFVWIDLLHIQKAVAPILTMFFSVPINFLMNKFWAYRKHK